MSGQLIQLPFKAGIDEGVDAKQLPPGTLKVGENCRQDKQGRIVKRHGSTVYEVQDLDTNIVTPVRILRNPKALVLSDGLDAIPAVGSIGSDFSRIDRIPSLAVTSKPLIDTTRTASQATCAVVGRWRITVFSAANTGYSPPGNGRIYVQVDDVDRNIVVMPPTLLNSSASQPRIFGYASTVAYIGYVTAAGSLKVDVLNPSLQTIATAATLKAGVSTWDGVIDVTNSILYVACSTGAGLHIERWAIGSPWVQTHTVNPVGAASYSCIAIDNTGGNLVRVVYSTTAPTTNQITRAAANLGAVAGPDVIDPEEACAIAVIGISGDRRIVVWTKVDGTYFHLTTTQNVFDDLTHTVDSAAGLQVTYHVAVASRLFDMNGRHYFCATVAVIPPAIATSNDTTVSPQSIVVLEADPDISQGIGTGPHRRMATLESRTSALQLWTVTQPAADTSGRVHVMAPRKQREPVGNEIVPTGAVVHVLDDQGEDWAATLDIGETDLCVGAAPFLIDGGTVFPYGFIHEPDIIDFAKGGGGTGSMGAGDYVYCCVYEWRDSRGVLHRSAPSAPVTVTGVVATGSVTLRIAHTCVDAKQSATTGFGTTVATPVRIAVYRTLAGGSVFYRLTHEPGYAEIFNDVANASATYLDDKADSSIAGSGPVVRLDSQPQLYTAQELEEVNPGAATTGTIHRGRAWLLGADRRTLQASKKFEEDASIAPGFNEAIALNFTSDKYWLASLDDKLVAGGDYIDVVFGDGPTSNGEQNDWQIQRVHSDVSCTNPHSVAVIPPGIVFRSTRGFELLDRGLNVTYIGNPVEDTLASYPNVTSAVLVPDEQEVRFTCVNDAGTAGVVIAFDYGYRAWYVRKYWDGAAFSAAFVDAALIDGVYTMLDVNGTLRQETTTHGYDDELSGGDKYVTMKASVPVYPNGAAGWHRLRAVQVVGESLDNHRLVVEVSRDFATSAEQTRTFEDGDPSTAIGPLEQAKVTLQYQKRQAAVVTIYDLEPDTTSYSTGRGPALELLALYIEPKQGPAKLPATQKG